ncbi:MAG: SRPBCC family protein [Paracoccus sp. (in: a-proteobacteria)]|nr:SRPBCC family protein [Paracoccus sp. (in: a-proteobacteria)]
MSQTETRTEGCDLVLTRHIAAPPEKVWSAWTTPDLLTRWFAPAPVQVPEAVIEAHPGGQFRIVMELPDGKRMSHPGCVLVAEEGRSLIFTDALDAGFRPRGQGFMTALIDIEPEGAGTRYTVRVLHKDGADCKKHEDMGFAQGWTAATAQLAALVEELAPAA